MTGDFIIAEDLICGDCLEHLWQLGEQEIKDHVYQALAGRFDERVGDRIVEKMKSIKQYRANSNGNNESSDLLI